MENEEWHKVFVLQILRVINIFLTPSVCPGLGGAPVCGRLQRAGVQRGGFPDRARGETQREERAVAGREPEHLPLAQPGLLHLRQVYRGR